MDDDVDIIARVRRGDVEAFRDLVLRHGPAVQRVVGGLLDRVEDREDVTQEVFLAIFRLLPRFDGHRGSFRSWALMIARHRSLNAMRNRPRASGLDERNVCDARPSHDAAGAAELFGRLDRALATLPAAQRTTFVLAELEGLPHREVARIEGVSVGTVKSRVSRLKARLRASLTDEAEER